MGGWTFIARGHFVDKPRRRKLTQFILNQESKTNNKIMLFTYHNIIMILKGLKLYQKGGVKK